MNSSTKILLLLALVALATADVVQQNLRALHKNRTHSANSSKLQSSVNSTNASSQQSNNTSTGSSNISQANSSPAAANINNSNSSAVSNNSNAAATNSTPASSTNATSSNNTSSSNGTDLFTLDQLEQIMPNSGNNSAYYYSYLNSAMIDGNITNCPRMAAFLAQIGHESGSLVYTTEIADGSEYEGIADIGNTEPGDGVKYKGRGLIQVTGKYNYEIVGEGLGYDFVDNPTALAEVPWCVTSAVWWWNNHSLSAIADANTQASFDQTTRIINGGYNGKADRDSRWATAKQVLGCA